ncbi:MAG: DUF2244 domain-containing protein [Pseudomonadota bacterium]
MVSSDIDDETGTVQIVLKPNRSWTWRNNVWVLASLFTLSLTIGIFFLFHRYWMILPFTLTEVAIVSACLYYCVRETHRQEVLRMGVDRVVLERGIWRPQERREFERYFTRFSVTQPPYRGHQKTVSLSCRGEDTEIGSFLPPADKDELIRVLKHAVSFLDAQLPPGGRQR